MYSTNKQYTVMSKSRLLQKINSVNTRYAKGLNDDDQVYAMCQEDKNTKGYSFLVKGEEYVLCTDEDKLQSVVDRYGYWSDQVKQFNTVLMHKGGYEYMTSLNAKYVGTSNSKQ